MKPTQNPCQPPDADPTCGIVITLAYFPSGTEMGAETVGLPCMMAISTRRFIRRFSGVVLGTSGWESAMPCTTSRP